MARSSRSCRSAIVTVSPAIFASPLSIMVQDDTPMRACASSVAVRADGLAAVAAGQGLVDADPGARARDEQRPRGLLGPAARDERAAGAGAQWPRVDCLLEEPHRAVEEGEVAAAGVEARSRHDHIITRVVVAVPGLELLLGVHRVKRREQRIA